MYSSLSLSLSLSQSKETLFGYNNQEILEVWPQTSLTPPPVHFLMLTPIPVQIGLNKSAEKKETERMETSPSFGNNNIQKNYRHFVSVNFFDCVHVQLY